MALLKFLATAVLIFSAQTPSLGAEKARLADNIHHKQISSDLANALALVSCSARLPMLAELAQPLPKISIAEGTHTANYLLREIVRQAPEYSWELQGPVIHFYSQRLAQARFNPLTRTFPRFVMPKNVSELKYNLPNLESTLLEDEPAQGAIMTGFGDPSLENDTLKSSVLNNVNGREVLIRAMMESATFSVFVVFASAEPTKEQARRADWAWQKLTGELRPIYADLPPKPKDDR